MWRYRYRGGRTLDRDNLFELGKADILTGRQSAGELEDAVHIIKFHFRNKNVHSLLDSNLLSNEIVNMKTRISSFCVY